MTKLFRNFVLLLAGLLAVSMLVGCGGDENPVAAEPVPVNFVSASPSGGQIATNAPITVTFDNAPSDIVVSTGTVKITGKTVVITGPFTLGKLTLTITWADGTKVLNYKVTGPDGPDVLRVTGGTIRDGDKDVNAESINSDGWIEITFTEEVTGNIALQTEDGADVGWIGKVEGYMATLELVKGKELTNATVYVVVGKISTADGIQQIDIKITFATKSKA